MTTTTTDPNTAAPPVNVHELFCGKCGYGIVIRRDPPECPMCRACEWQQRPGFARWK